MNAMRAPNSTPVFEVMTRSAYDEALVFSSADEDEAVAFAINYFHDHPGQNVAVVEERYDPNDRLFKTRRVWSRSGANAGTRGGQRSAMCRA
jgi:hypothetical protein